MTLLDTLIEFGSRGFGHQFSGTLPDHAGERQPPRERGHWCGNPAVNRALRHGRFDPCRSHVRCEAHVRWTADAFGQPRGEVCGGVAQLRDLGFRWPVRMCDGCFARWHIRKNSKGTPMDISAATKADLLRLWSDTQMRAAYYSTMDGKTAEILYEVEDIFREEHRTGTEGAFTARQLVTMLREGHAEVSNRWRTEMDIERHGIR